MRLHFTRVGFEEVLNLGWVGDTGVEPPVIVVGGKDDRHPVVDRRHRFVGRYGEDRAAQDFIVPQVVKPGEADGRTARELDVVGRVVSTYFISGRLARWTSC